MSLSSGAKRFNAKLFAAMDDYVKSAAQELEAEMKTNAPWKDRTGDARKRLTAEAQDTISGYQIKLAQGVDYGVYLELAHEKKYAIIQPTIAKKSGEVTEGFSDLINKIKK